MERNVLPHSHAFGRRKFTHDADTGILTTGLFTVFGTDEINAAETPFSRRENVDKADQHPNKMPEKKMSSRNQLPGEK
jgi:hypothetical protein